MHGARETLCCEIWPHRITETEGIIHTSLVALIVKMAVGWTNQDDEEVFKGKAYSFFLLQIMKLFAQILTFLQVREKWLIP